jgi:hypothetical protein
MLEISIFLMGCFVIVIHALVKKIVILRQDVALLKMLLNMKVVSKICEEHPEMLEICMEDEEDGKSDKSG